MYLLVRLETRSYVLISGTTAWLKRNSLLPKRNHGVMFPRVSVRRENMVKSSSSSVSSQQHDLGSLPVWGSTVFEQLHVACDIGLPRKGGGAFSVFLPLTSSGGCDIEWGGALRVPPGGGGRHQGGATFRFCRKVQKYKCSLVKANPAVRTDHLDFTSATDLLT